MIIQINTDQHPPLKRWYADDTRADSLKQILQNPILSEAITIIKHLHRPIMAAPYRFEDNSEKERSAELARKEGIFYALEFLEGLSNVPLKEEKKETSAQFVSKKDEEERKNFKPKTVADLEPLKTNKPTPQ